MCKVFPLLRRVKRDTYCILVGDFEVRVRVRRVIRQKAHVRAKCVRGKTSKCGVRACDGKFVALQHSGFLILLIQVVINNFFFRVCSIIFSSHFWLICRIGISFKILEVK